MAAKLRADYSAVLHMPVLKEGKDRPLGSNMHGNQNYAQPGKNAITSTSIIDKSLLISWAMNESKTSQVFLIYNPLVFQVMIQST